MRPPEQRERRAAYMRACRAADPEKFRARDRAYRAADPEKYRARDAARYARDPERGREQRRAYRAANIDKVRAQDRLRQEHRVEYRREYNRTMKHGITRMVRDWMYESQDRACAGCLVPMPDEKLQVDHDHGCCSGNWACGRCVRGLVCSSCNVRDVLTRLFAERFPEWRTA